MCSSSSSPSLCHIIRVNGCRVHLMLWDTAGQEEFDALTKAYYRVSDGCVLAFSTIDRNSFDAVEKWKKKVEYECGSIPMVLCQNKCDMMDQSRVPSDCVERLAKSLNLPVFMTSSKNNVNIDRGECHARRFMLIASSRCWLSFLSLSFCYDCNIDACGQSFTAWQKRVWMHHRPLRSPVHWMNWIPLPHCVQVCVFLFSFSPLIHSSDATDQFEVLSWM